jgi:hypothetical protein
VTPKKEIDMTMDKETAEVRGRRKYDEFRDELRRASTGLVQLLGELFIGLGKVDDAGARDSLLLAFRKEIAEVLKARKTERAKPAESVPTPAAEPPDDAGEASIDAALEQALAKVLGPARSGKAA